MSIFKLSNNKSFVLVYLCILWYFYYAMNISATSNLGIEGDMNVHLYRVASLAPFLTILFSLLFDNRGRRSRSDVSQVVIFTFCVILATYIVVSPVASGAILVYKVLSQAVYPYLFYVYMQKNYHYVSNRIWILLMFITVALFAYVYYTIFFQTLLLYDESSVWITVYLVAFLPLILKCVNLKVKLLLIAIVFVCVLTNVKRSAFIALVGSFVIFYFINNKVNETNSIRRFSKIIIYMVFFSVAFWAYSHFTDSIILERLYRIEEDRGSGRIDIYDDLLGRIKQSSLSEDIFGHGYLASMQLSSSERSAHNDFLEVFFDFGVIGFIPYISMHIALIIKTIRMIRIRHVAAPVFASAYFIFLLFSSTSIVVFNPIFSLFTIVWGIANCTKYNNCNKLLRFR